MVRHGITNENSKGIISGWKDYEISLEGIEYSKLVGEKLQNKNISLIISSDLLRAKQTAEIISFFCQCNVQYDSRLRERFLGSHEGKFEDEINHISLVGAEEYATFFLRVRSVIKDLMSKYSNQSMLIVTHGGVLEIINKVLCKHINKIKDQPFNYMKMELCNMNISNVYMEMIKTEGSNVTYE